MRRFGNRALSRLTRDELLDTRIRDLGVRIERTPLEERIKQVLREVEARDLSFRPHFWLSGEWFTPDGVPGVAIPFYLAHSRLLRLERQEMLEAEGASEESCLRILRHELGHAIDNAYRLRRRRSWRRVFGAAGAPYPESYRPRPYSRKFVVNIEPWYAQSHPVEDFAETFAVWLTPRSRWRQTYADWPALHKLEYVDDLMRHLARERPLVSNRRRVEPLRTDGRTLREYYHQKRAQHEHDLQMTSSFDHDLRRLFSDVSTSGTRTAASALTRLRARIRASVAAWTGVSPYAIDRVLRGMIERCRRLGLRMAGPEDEVERGVTIAITMRVVHDITRGTPRVKL